MTRRYFKPSLRDTMRANDAAQRHYAAMAGVEPAADLLNDLPEKRSRKPSGEPLEQDTIKAVADLLAVHPAVLFAVRQNSGALFYQPTSGRPAPLWFFRWVRRPERMRLADFWGATHDCRVLAIECKRESWRGPSDEREREQERFINCVLGAGGRAGFARSADEARAIVERRPLVDPGRGRMG